VLVAVVADTHLPRGSRALPADCLRRLAAADLIVHAGDLSSLAFLEQLRAIGPPVHAVFGNVDEDAVRRALPKELVVEAGETRIAVVHVPGPLAGREERLAKRFPGCDAVVYGHTHRPQVTRHGGVWILNPGSPTERRREPAHTMIELTVRGREIAPALIELHP
jgi:putative phosphoesterase